MMISHDVSKGYSSIVSKGTMNSFREMFPPVRMFPLVVMRRGYLIPLIPYTTYTLYHLYLIPYPTSVFLLKQACLFMVLNCQFFTVLTYISHTGISNNCVLKFYRMGTFPP